MRFLRHKWLRRLVVWVLLPVVLGIGYYQYNYPTCTFRYKLTAEVMTPQGLKTGSSVIEVSYQNLPSLSGVVNLNLSAKGEAVLIPLDDRKLLAVTLISTNKRGLQFRSYDDSPKHMQSPLDAHALPLKVFGLQWYGFDERALSKDIKAVRNSKATYPVPFHNLPMLVVFNDIANPDSVVEIQPDEIQNTLGSGFKLLSAKLHLTDDLPTDTGMQIFPWWERKAAEWKSKWIFSTDDKLIDKLYYGAFKQPKIVGKAK